MYVFFLKINNLSLFSRRLITFLIATLDYFAILYSQRQRIVEVMGNFNRLNIFINLDRCLCSLGASFLCFESNVGLDELSRINVSCLDQICLDCQDPEVPYGLKMESVVVRVPGPDGVKSTHQGSNAKLAAADIELSRPHEQEAKGHIHGHLVSVVHLGLNSFSDDSDHSEAFHISSSCHYKTHGNNTHAKTILLRLLVYKIFVQIGVDLEE